MRAGPTCFENKLSSRSFSWAVALPPLFFWAMVVVVGGPLLDRNVSLPQFLLLVGLANALPLLALAWTLFSVCAASIEGGRLVVHRVAYDRAWPLQDVRLTAPPGPHGDVCLRAGRDRFRLHPDRPALFVQMLRGSNPEAVG